MADIFININNINANNINNIMKIILKMRTYLKNTEKYKLVLIGILKDFIS